MPTVLVMWEYTCDHSPIWARSDDLADWNARVEHWADPSDLLDRPPTAAEARGRQVESFGLAARAQRELGDTWTVWCLAGGGDGGMRDPGAFEYLRRTSGPQILLRDGGPVDWTPTRVAPSLDVFPAALQEEALAWRADADRLARAEHRARALELAGRLHAALETGRVLWFGGADVPA